MMFLTCNEYQFLEEENSASSRSVGTHFSKPIIPEYYNHSVKNSFGEYEPWDHYILDDDIVKLLRMMYKPAPDHRFAQEIDSNPFIKFFFTPPFSFTAKELGYAPLEKFADLP
jgi:hypothetical protein